MKPALILASAALACMLLVGCSSDGPERVEVEGVVLLDGQPLDQIWVEFWPEQGPQSAGSTDAEGKFVLKALDLETAGVVTGPQKVTLKDNSVYDLPAGKRLTPSEKRGMDLTSGTKPRISERYSNPQTTPLTVTITGSKKDLKFEVEPYQPR